MTRLVTMLLVMMIFSICVPAGFADGTVSAIRLYLPDKLMRERIGDDAIPLSNYIKKLESETTAFLSSNTMRGAKGIYIGVGVKPALKSRIWCEAVDGIMPAPTLKALEKHLEKVTPINVKAKTIAFSLQYVLEKDAKVEFPVLPKTWTDLAKKSSKKDLMVPDELFEMIWP